MGNIPLSRPDITDKEINAVVSVLKTPNLSLGPKLSEFEAKFAKYIGSKYAVGVNSGTAGLHLCIKSLGIKDGDEVITTPFSFIASANCILFERARPVFVDIRKGTLNIDESKIEEKITKRTKAILPVHIFGYPCEMVEIKELAKKYRLAIVEDACEAIGAEYHGEKVGTLGDCGVFAFYPNKQMTTGEGGMIVTNNNKIVRLCRSLRNQGRDRGVKWLVHNRLGYNYRISDINCALGIAQVSRIRHLLKKRETVAKWYNEDLKNIEEISLPIKNKVSIKRSFFVYVIQLKETFNRTQRDFLIEKLRKSGIGCNNYLPPIHLQPYYQEQFGYKKGDFPTTEKISDLTIALPFFNQLNKSTIKYIAKKLKEGIREVLK